MGKLRAGKKVGKEEFSIISDDNNTIKLLLKEAGDKDDICQTPMGILLNEIENDTKLLLTAPLKLSQPDELIIQSKEYLNDQKTSGYGAYTGLVNSSRNGLDISVSPGNVGRSLRFMDTLIKLLRTRGHKLKIEDGITNVIIGDEKIKIRLKEKVKRIPGKDKWTSTDYLANLEMEGKRMKEERIRRKKSQE